MKRLAEKVVIVTGAASGLGRAIALLFAAEGARIIAADINKEGLKNLRDEVSLSGGVITTVTTNMLNPDHIDNMIAVAMLTHGTVDVLVNNAGIMDDFSPVADVKDDMWWRVMETNLNGPFRAMRSVLKIMLENKSGVIINIASLGGIQGARAGAAYTASKHALIGLTKNTGYMYAGSGIRCNAIAPGAIETTIADSIDFDKLLPLVSERMMPGMVLNPRSSDPAEIARVSLFLASDEASFVNGTVITADGGWSAY